MRIKRTLALLLVLILAFGIISTASASGYQCKFCRSTNVDKDTVYAEPSYWIEEKTFPDGKLYYREWVHYWNVYTCGTCGEEWQYEIKTSTPWKLSNG